MNPAVERILHRQLLKPHKPPRLYVVNWLKVFVIIDPDSRVTMNGHIRGNQISELINKDSADFFPCNPRGAFLETLSVHWMSAGGQTPAC